MDIDREKEYLSRSLSLQSIMEAVDQYGACLIALGSLVQLLLLLRSSSKNRLSFCVCVCLTNVPE